MSIFSIVAASAAAVFLLAWLRAAARIRHLRHQVELARYASSHDRLTGLPTRETAERAFLYRAVHALPGALGILDLDHFKRVNDTYGHEAGDALLIEVAQVLSNAVQTYSGLACRVSGDEFIVLIPGRFDPDSDGGPLGDAIGDLQAHLTTPIILVNCDETITIRVTASAGAAVFDGVHGTFATLLRRADVALYQAKQHRGSYVIYQPGMSMPPAAGHHGPRRRDHHPADQQNTTDHHPSYQQNGKSQNGKSQNDVRSGKSGNQDGRTEA